MLLVLPHVHDSDPGRGPGSGSGPVPGSRPLALSTVDGKRNFPPPGFLAVDHSDFIFQAFPAVPMDSF